MRAYYYDNLPGHQTLPHDSGLDVSEELLARLGVLYWNISPSLDQEEKTERINAIAREREYRNRDEINVTKEGLGDQYEKKLEIFFAEHMHEDEEIRYVEEGSGFFDVRELSNDRWVRIHVTPGDLLVLPAGIYHRFTLDENNKVRAMRLFKDEPKWVPHNRGEETDQNEYRKAYVQRIRPSVAASA